MGGFLALGTLLGALGFYLAFLRNLPDLQNIADYKPPLSSRVFDRHGEPIGEFFIERRALTPLEEVPQHVIHAFVAGEDSSFFEHSGIDLQSILRAAWKNLLAGENVQGGSTITQQMVKGLLLTPERTYRRKIREAILARDIEQRFSKHEILYLYLNQIYFGHGAHGIGQAARAYFDKPVSELDVSEGAMLAGLPKAPSRYSPYARPEEAEKRRLYVLERMLEDGYLDEEAYTEALAQPPELADAQVPDTVEAAAYFTEEVRRRLFDELGGELVLNGGLRIETTLDGRQQQAAVAAVKRGLEDLDKRRGYRGPLRRVAEDEIEAELERLAVQNGLAEAVEEAEPEEAPEPDETPEQDVELAETPPEEPPAPPDDGFLLGIVTAVDVAGQRARVAFGAGLEAVVRLQDVAWARKPQPGTAPSEVKSIDAVFATGDTAYFRLLEPDELGDDAAADERYAALHQQPLVQGALLSLDVASGEVLAMVGGYDFGESQFNRATQARRQPGSAFKPLIYAAAIAHDYTPASILFDRPVVYVDKKSGFSWRPQNYGRSFYGPITMRQALVRSVNNATVHLFRDVGVDRVIEFARDLGIESPLNRDLSLALGSSSLSLLELTRAYAVFPAGGRRVVPRFIRRVTDREGEVLLENVPLDATPLVDEAPAEPSELLDVAAETGPQNGHGSSDRVIAAEVAYLASDLLRAVVTDPKGTGWRLRALGRPVAGKTGTTNDQADAWFMGFAPQIATGVWVGHDESRFLGWGETGSRAAAPIWVDYMAEALKGLPVVDFPVPEDIVFARIDRETGLLADGAASDTIFQPFLTGTVPTETARTHRTASEGRRMLRMDSF